MMGLRRWVMVIGMAGLCTYAILIFQLEQTRTDLPSSSGPPSSSGHAWDKARRVILASGAEVTLPGIRETELPSSPQQYRTRTHSVRAVTLRPKNKGYLPKPRTGIRRGEGAVDRPNVIPHSQQLSEDEIQSELASGWAVLQDSQNPPVEDNGLQRHLNQAGVGQDDPAPEEWMGKDGHFPVLGLKQEESFLNVETQQVGPESDVGQEDSESDVGIEDSESDVGIEDSESDVGIEDSESDVGMEDSESDVGKDDSESDVGMDDSESDVGMEDSGSRSVLGRQENSESGVKVGQDHLKSGLGHENSESGRDESKSSMGQREDSGIPLPVQSAVSDLHISKRRTRPNLVIILTEGRSGSTWLMETLNLPNNSFSFFEPLNSEITKRFKATQRENETDTDLAVRWRLRIFTGICTCKLTTYESGTISGWQKNYPRDELKRHKIPEVTDHCLRTQVRIAKPIRLYNVSDIRHLEDTCPSYKVIHLMRDPRAVMLSRMVAFRELYDGNRKLGAYVEGGRLEGFTDEYVGEAARAFCNHHLHSIREGRKPWLRDRYRAVRYEDFAGDPMRVARELYHFIGQPFTLGIKESVYAASHQTKGFGGYDTHKNSSKVLGSWKSRLLDRHLVVIDRVCKEYMEVMGYPPGR